MFGDAVDADNLNDGRAFDMLRELEQNTPDALRKQRTHFRLSIKARVMLTSGNASARLDFKIQCVTGDVSEGGCRLLSPVPIAVGDIYRLEFDRATLNLPVVYARCMRCSLLRDDAYEAGMAFFAPVALPECIEESASEPLA